MNALPCQGRAGIQSRMRQLRLRLRLRLLLLQLMTSIPGPYPPRRQLMQIRSQLLLPLQLLRQIGQLPLLPA